MPRLAPGQTILGRYAVQAVVGEGPLGEVYDVSDGQMGAHYALKLFAPHLGQSPAWGAYLGTVQRVSAMPGAARVFDAGIDAATGSPYVLSELLSIPVLGDLVSRGRLPPPLVGQVLKSLATVLSHAHAMGLSHGALHPGNVFVQGTAGAALVRLTDLGTAFLRAAAPPPSGPFRLGWVAPEQAQGAPPSPAMDVWAMGVLAFFALAGKSPFLAMRAQQADWGALWGEISAPFPPASQRAADLGVGLHESMNPWFARALSPNPAERFGSALEAADAFVAVAPNVGLGGTFLLENASTNAQLAAAQVAWADTQAIPAYTGADLTAQSPLPNAGPMMRPGSIPTPPPGSVPSQGQGMIPTPPPGSMPAMSAPGAMYASGPTPAPAMGAYGPPPVGAPGYGPPPGMIGTPPPGSMPAVSAPKKGMSPLVFIIPLVLLVPLVGGAVWFFGFRSGETAQPDHGSPAASASTAPDVPASAEPPPAAGSAEPEPPAASGSTAAKAPPPPVKGPLPKGPFPPLPTKVPPKPTVGGGDGIRQKGK